MRCKKCKGKTRVVDSRATSDEVIRRRVCTDCGCQCYTRELRDTEARDLMAYAYKRLKV